MLFEEKKAEEKKVYDWPKSYYMETDAVQRKRLLEEQLMADDSEETQKIKQLFECRYKKMKDGKYMDVFLKEWMVLFLIGNDLKSFFSQKRNRKMAQEAAEALCLGREAEFGTDILYDELGHLAGTYIVSCLNDSNYRSVLFNIGRMKEDKVKQKIRNDLELVSKIIPEAVGMKEEFSLFEKAVSDMQERLL